MSVSSLEWMNWNKLIFSFASSLHWITRISLQLAEPRICAGPQLCCDGQEGVGRRSLQGYRCLDWSVLLICATKVVPHGKESLWKKKKIRVLLKGKMLGTQKRENILLQKHQNTLQCKFYFKKTNKLASSNVILSRMTSVNKTLINKSVEILCPLMHTLFSNFISKVLSMELVFNLIPGN